MDASWVRPRVRRTLDSVGAGAWRLELLLVLSLLVVSADIRPARADDQESSPEATLDLTPEQLGRRIKRAEEDTSLGKDTRARLVELYKQSFDERRLLDERIKKKEAFKEAVSSAPKKIEALKKELAKPDNSDAAPPDVSASLSDLEQAVQAAEKDLSDAQSELAELDGEPKRRSMRLVELSQLATGVAERLEDIEQQLVVIVPDDNSEMNLAQRAWLTARRKALAAESAMYEVEQQSYDAPAGELLQLQREKAARTQADAEKRVTLLRKLVAERRRDETDKQETDQRLEKERLAAAMADPVVRRVAEENERLARQRKLLSKRLEQVDRDSEHVAARLAKLRLDVNRVMEKAEAADFTDAIGQLLRKRRSDLPNVRQIRGSLRVHQQEIANVQYEYFDLDDRRAELSDVDARVAELRSEQDPPSAVSEAELRKHVKTQRDYVARAVFDYDVYQRKLINLVAAERDLATEVEAFGQFIDQRVLWIRSTSEFTPADLGRVWRALSWFVDGGTWLAAAEDLAADLRANPLVVGLPLLGALVLVASRRRLRRMMRPLAKQAAREHTMHFSPTFKTVIGTILLTVGWPAMIWLVGWRMSLDMNEFTGALAIGLLSIASMLAPLEAVRHTCRIGGLAEVHFGWPRSILSALRRLARGLAYGGLPVVFVATAIEGQTIEAHKESLGRICFVAGMALLAVWMHLGWKPLASALRQTAMRNHLDWIDRMRHLWFCAFVAGPLALGALAAAGYYYTALRLAWRLQASLWLIMGLAFVYAMFLRWLTVVHRRLSVQSAERAADSPPSVALTEDASIVAVDAPGIDLSTIDMQSRRLLRAVMISGLVVGLGIIWIDILPALGVLNRIVLWPGSDPGTALTLGDFALAVVITVLTSIAARNIPGLLEIIVLQRLPLEAAVRYAISIVCRYCIVLTGTIAAFGSLHIAWPQLQWLIAAITVGLGFGLQEIFANFISGLIVLFERPMRVGDVITVGEVTGTVSRIRMRATTITDADRKELIVPNKEFITGRLVNWTLTDKVIRMVIRVGVAYGSDTQLAQRLLLQAAESHKLVLNDPAPRALFTGFGDSTLQFELRVFMAGLDSYPIVQHELNTAIDVAFRAHGIEIAFPQCDVHVRSIDSALPLMRHDMSRKVQVALHTPEQRDLAAGA